MDPGIVHCGFSLVSAIENRKSKMENEPKRRFLTMAEYAPEIKELGDKIVTLSLLQAKALGDYLKEVHGIEAAAGGVMMAAAPGAGAGAAAPEATTHHSRCSNHRILPRRWQREGAAGARYSVPRKHYPR